MFSEMGRGTAATDRPEELRPRPSPVGGVLHEMSGTVRPDMLRKAAERVIVPPRAKSLRRRNWSIPARASKKSVVKPVACTHAFVITPRGLFRRSSVGRASDC